MKARLAKNSPATGRKPASERVKKLSQTSDRKGKRVLSEDEADILYCEKHKHEKAIPWEQVKAKLDAMDGDVALGNRLICFRSPRRFGRGFANKLISSKTAPTAFLAAGN